jgi:transposase-like protein
MKVYQMGEGSVNGSIKIIDSGVLYAKASEGLLALSASLGLEVVRMMLEEDVTGYAGPKGKHNTAERVGYRHGTESTEVVMGGQKVHTGRPRVRATDGSGELPLDTLEVFQREDPLNKAILSRLLRGVSTRKYAGTVDTPAAETSCTSKSEVSRRFIAGMEQAMGDFFSRPIVEGYPVVMVDGLQLGKMTIVAVMGIDDDGKKRILGITEGGTENSTIVKDLFADLIKRGLSPAEPRLYVLDGSKALHKAVLDTFGVASLVQRCQVHKKRNVLSYLPESEQTNISLAISNAYKEFDYQPAKDRLLDIAAGLEHKYPKAAGSLMEGLEETLTVHKLGVPGLLRETLSNTNAMESANSACRGILRRVSTSKTARWRFATRRRGSWKPSTVSEESEGISRSHFLRQNC